MLLKIVWHIYKILSSSALLPLLESLSLPVIFQMRRSWKTYLDSWVLCSLRVELKKMQRKQTSRHSPQICELLAAPAFSPKFSRLTFFLSYNRKKVLQTQRNYILEFVHFCHTIQKPFPLFAFLLCVKNLPLCKETNNFLKIAS